MPVSERERISLPVTGEPTCARAHRADHDLDRIDHIGYIDRIDPVPVAMICGAGSVWCRSNLQGNLFLVHADHPDPIRGYDLDHADRT